MNLEQSDIMRTPQLLAYTGLIKLEEAVLELLFQEHSYLTTAEMSDKLLIESEKYRAIGYNHPILESVLRKLEREKRVERDKPTNSRWGLTEANSFYLRGAEKLELQKYAAAIEDFNEAIRLDPTVPFFYFDRAVSKQCLNQVQEALADIDKAIHLGGQLSNIPRRITLSRTTPN